MQAAVVARGWSEGSAGTLCEVSSPARQLTEQGSPPPPVASTATQAHHPLS